jgi:hypothetical protein
MRLLTIIVHNYKIIACIRGPMDHADLRTALPQNFRRWAEDNRALLVCITQAKRNHRRVMSDAEFWDVIAEATSDEWGQAKSKLNARDKELQERLHPDNVPLGLIGMGLDGGSLDKTERAHSNALVEFTVINEHLYQQPELRALLKAAVQIQRMAEHSLYLSQQTHKLTLDFASAMGHPGQKRNSILRAAFHRIFNNRGEAQNPRKAKINKPQPK